jgi:hypothetical protein
MDHSTPETLEADGNTHKHQEGDQEEDGTVKGDCESAVAGQKLVQTPHRGVDDNDNDDDDNSKDGWSAASDDDDEEEEKDDDDDDGEDVDDKKKYPRLNKCFNTFPRCTAICVRIVIPLWILISISLVFGLVLANFEAPGEYASNDETVKERYVLSLFPANETTAGLTNMSRNCLDYYSNIKYNRTAVVKNPFLTLVGNAEFSDHNFPNISVGFDDQTPESVLGEAMEYANVCADLAEDMYEVLYNYTASVVNEEILSDLTFNWIRCWNSSSVGGTAFDFVWRRLHMGHNYI